MRVVLAVELLIPDNTAFSAKTALAGMGIDLTDLKRMDYYEFELSADDGFAELICKTDIIVNANKHKAHVTPSFTEGTSFVVMDTEQGDGLLKTLRDRLGFKSLTGVKKGTLWQFFAEREESKLAKQALDQLLHNPHYQEYYAIKE